MDSALIEAAKGIVNPLIAQLPDTLFGLERMMYIGDMVKDIDNEKKSTLKKLIEIGRAHV